MLQSLRCLPYELVSQLRLEVAALVKQKTGSEWLGVAIKAILPAAEAC